jgi:hypothetical protein
MKCKINFMGFKRLDAGTKDTFQQIGKIEDFQAYYTIRRIENEIK